jgi:hypothetical protein
MHTLYAALLKESRSVSEYFTQLRNSSYSPKVPLLGTNYARYNQKLEGVSRSSQTILPFHRAESARYQGMTCAKFLVERKP